MITLRKAEDRGHADHGWLDTWHTFSFADYRDPRWVHFASLRVINEDFVAPGAGFPTHGHEDMEIVTWVLEGSLQHKDSLGTGSVIRPGDAQRMSAGTGILHSEFNASKTERLHLLQIWILPEKKGIAPGYEQKTLDLAKAQGALLPVATRDGRGGSVTIHQDAAILVARLAKGQRVAHELGKGRKAWVHVARGAATVTGNVLSAGDAAGIDGLSRVEIVGENDAEVLVFDLA